MSQGCFALGPFWPLCSAQERRWARPVADPAGVVEFHRVVLTPDGKSYAYTFFRSPSRLYVVQGLK